MFDPGEMFVRLCGEVGHLSERLTGVSVVDAYFGPDELHPDRQRKDREGEELHAYLMAVADTAREELTEPPLRGEYVASEAESLAKVVEWLDGRSVSYETLVMGFFGVEARRFPDTVVEGLRERVAEALDVTDDSQLFESVVSFEDSGRVEGAELKRVIEETLQPRAKEIGRLFAERVFNCLGASVTDNGVKYEAVQDRAWGGYNYYQGDYRSINQFNIDRSFNRDSLTNVVYHEYGHHVSNVWRERAYREHGYTELSIVPLHTGRCVISEGVADTVRDFLGVKETGWRSVIVNALRELRQAVRINAAYMLNVEGWTTSEARRYVMEAGLVDERRANAILRFISPETEDGRVNFWAPYVYTYYFGRTEYVLPTWERAVETNRTAEFFRTLYLNPFSGSSATWNEAFDWLR